MNEIEFFVEGVPVAQEPVEGQRAVGIETTSDLEWSRLVYSAYARGGDDEAMYYAVVEGEPWSKARPRFARKTGRTYQPGEDLHAERAMREALRRFDPSPFLGNVMLACRFYRSSSQRVDTDNLLKHICDSATGVLWKDDSQVTLILGEILLDVARPRSVIVVGHHHSTLKRGSDRDIACEHCGTEFTPSHSTSTKRFCSKSCSYAARTVTLDDLVCGQCGATFTPTNHRQRLCSKECSTSYRTGRRKDAAKAFSKCAECGKELAHSRGGRCRDCWRANPGFYGEAT